MEVRCLIHSKYLRMSSLALDCMVGHYSRGVGSSTAILVCVFLNFAKFLNLMVYLSFTHAIAEFPSFSKM